MIKMEEIYFLIKLCPRMYHLQIDFIRKKDVELFLRNILMKINNDCNLYLRLLCIQVPKADDKMIKKLKEMINLKNLVRHYIIKRVLIRTSIDNGNDYLE